MYRVVENYFRLKDLNTNIRTEIVVGLTTFMTMAYIIFVNPAMISQTGMGENVFFTYSICIGMGISWLVYLLALLFILRFVYLKPL